MPDEQQPMEPLPPFGEAPADPLQAKCDEAILGWKRALADYDNLKKDLSRERVDMRREATVRVAQGFLSVLDNFDAAIKFTPDNIDPKLQGWLSGILFIRTQLETALRDLGLEPFAKISDAFDPNLHEAVSERDEEGKNPGTVLDVVRRGWKMGDKIVRSASVVVSK